MSKTIQQDIFAAELLNILDETFDTTHGIYLDKDTSLFRTLEGISFEEASLPVGGKCASLAAQVSHVTFYLEVLERYLVTRESVSSDWGAIWRTVEKVNAEEWAGINSKLRETHQRIWKLLSEIENWDDSDILGGALAIVVHSAYHLGEIRQAMCTLRN